MEPEGPGDFHISKYIPKLAFIVWIGSRLDLLSTPLYLKTSFLVSPHSLYSWS